MVWNGEVPPFYYISMEIKRRVVAQLANIQVLSLVWGAQQYHTFFLSVHKLSDI